MVKGSCNLESEREDGRQHMIGDKLSSLSPNTSCEERINPQDLIKSEDKVSDSSLNSDSSDNENNNNEIPHIESTKRSLLKFNINDAKFRRVSSPAVLEKREVKKQDQDYFTLQDYLNKNFCVRENSISVPDADIVESGGVSSRRRRSNRSTSTDGENAKEKKLQKVRLFFMEHCMYKLILCLPFGFLTTISILGLKGDPINFVSYIIIFTLVVFYPIACLLWLLYKLLLPYYQMCRYTPNASGTEKESEKGEGDTEYSIPTILAEKPTDSTKSLAQTVYERRRSISARRRSSLPAIEEDDTLTTEEDEGEENYYETINKNNKDKGMNVNEKSVENREQTHM